MTLPPCWRCSGDGLNDTSEGRVGSIVDKRTVRTPQSNISHNCRIPTIRVKGENCLLKCTLKYACCADIWRICLNECVYVKWIVLISWGYHSKAAGTGVPKQQTCTASQFWRWRSEISVSGGLVRPGALRAGSVGPLACRRPFSSFIFSPTSLCVRLWATFPFG